MSSGVSFLSSLRDSRRKENVPVATFITKGLQTIAQIKNKSRCSDCGRRGEVEMVIYFRNAVDVERNENIGNVHF
jgi:sRNA-binding regulator protein Hfq